MSGHSGHAQSWTRIIPATLSSPWIGVVWVRGFVLKRPEPTPTMTTWKDAAFFRIFANDGAPLVLKSWACGMLLPEKLSHPLSGHRQWRRGSIIALTLLAELTLSACSEEKQNSAPGRGAAPKPEVSVVTVHPQSVAITAELPGRMVASLIAEVRPQVSGIIQFRPFKEGSEVVRGDVLYQIDPASYQACYDSAVASLRKAEAAVPNAQAKVNRYQGLVKENAISKQDFDDALSTLEQARADIASAKASMETARINLAYTKVTAPINGRIDASTVTVGALVTADQTTALATIRTLDPIKVDVTQSSVNLLRFRAAVTEGRIKMSGPNVSVKLRLEDGTIYSHGGELQFAEANIEQATGTFTVRAEFPNPDRLLLPGMYVRAIIQEGMAENGILVPQRAVTRNTKGEAIAKIVNVEGKVEERVLAVRRSIGNSWLIDAGLSDGARVIVEGTQLVRPGGEGTATDVTIDDATGEIRSRSKSATAISHESAALSFTTVGRF